MDYYSAMKTAEARGKIKAKQDAIGKFLAKRFGQVSAEIQAKIQQLTGLETLDRVMGELFAASSPAEARRIIEEGLNKTSPSIRIRPKRPPPGRGVPAHLRRQALQAPPRLWLHQARRAGYRAGYRAAEFKEKPDEQTALAYLEKGCLWNSGMFMLGKKELPWIWMTKTISLGWKSWTPRRSSGTSCTGLN
jgi:hypothetical protein